MPDEKLPTHPIETPSDIDLVKAAQKDPQAFLAIYDRWVSAVFRYFMNGAQDQSVAEDLTSQLFIKVYRALPNFRFSGSFPGWLFRIAHNLAVDYFRRLKREKDFIRSQVREKLIGNHLSETEITLLNDHLKALDQQTIELLRLRFTLQLSFAQIGEVIGISEQVAKKRLYRAVERLRLEMGVSDEQA